MIKKSKIFRILVASLIVCTVLIGITIFLLFLNNSDDEVYVYIAGCEKLSNERYKWVCYQSEAKEVAQENTEIAEEICSRIKDYDMENECYNDIALSLASSINTTTVATMKDAIHLCKRISSLKWRSECYFNLALVHANTSFDEAILMCDKAEIYRSFCYHDVVGKISIISPNDAMKICSNLDKDLDKTTRKTCFHGIGRFLGQTSVVLGLKTCGRVEKDDIIEKQNCYHGLGWGVAETINSTYVLSVCRMINNSFADYCITGAAWYVATSKTKNNEIDARTLCNEITNKTMFVECLDFPNTDK